MIDKEKLDKLVAEIERRYKYNKEHENDWTRSDYFWQKKEDEEILSFIDSMQKEPKDCMYSKDNYTDEDRKVLCDGCEEECKFNKKEEPVNNGFEAEVKKLWMEINTGHSYSIVDSYNIFYGLCMDIADWQKENLWKPADGEDLPEINREVIALLGWGKVVFAHRPPEYWDGKDIVTGKVTRHYPKTYDKGGWNIPDVKYWLDVELPKEIEL